MAKKKNDKKSRRKPAISLFPREIYFVELDPYKTWCPHCKEETSTLAYCGKCEKTFTPTQEQKGERPVIVVQPPVVNASDRDDALVLAIPLTTGEARSFPDTVKIPANTTTGLGKPGDALVFNLISYDRRRFYQEEKKGTVEDEQWEEIINKLKTLIGIDQNTIKIGGEVFYSSKIEKIIEMNELLIQKNNTCADIQKEIQRKDKEIKRLKERINELEEAQELDVID